LNQPAHRSLRKPAGTVEALLFMEQVFENLNFVGTLFARVKFVRCTFKNCDFSHAFFDTCDVYDCSFSGCVFYFCQLEQCELTKTRFNSSFLSGIRLRSCDLTRTQFGDELPIIMNRKIQEVPPGGLPNGVLLTGHASAVPCAEELEKSHLGLAVQGCEWYIAFLSEDTPRRRDRRRSVLAAHLANQLLSFGRGDSGKYNYLAREYARRSETTLMRRLFGRIEKDLWGYGYKPWRLLRAGVLANLLAILAYLIFNTLGWGTLEDSKQPIEATGLSGLGQYLYYCTVVGTTLGFGDIVPVRWCRLILVLQALANVALVGMWLSSMTSPLREWRIPEDAD
jgi:hypothetical protein